MNTVTSSRRNIVMPPAREAPHANVYHILALVAGLVLMVAGIRTNLEVLMIPGFIAFIYSFLYLNCMFWAYMYDKKKFNFTRTTYWI